MKDLVGKVLNDYEILAFVGKGGHGAVYRAKHSDMEQDVALKVLLPEHAKDDDIIQRIHIEAEIIRDLQHPNIVSLIDTWEDEHGLWMVMPWLSGGDLRDYIEAHGRISPQDLSPILDQVCSALEAAHESQTVHRDLKPDNIMLDEAGNAYLTDFGIAKRMNFTPITTMGVVMGSPDYLSPEQIMGQPISIRTDIYALGITIYELLAGQHPFAEEVSKVKLMMLMVKQDLPALTEEDAPPEFLDALNQLIQRCTAKQADERYENASAVTEHFREIIASINEE